MYAEVIVDISHEKLDRPFTYKIPKSLEGIVEEGTNVEIPFGVGNKVINGIVIRIKDSNDYDPYKTKELIGIAKGSVKADTNLIKLATFNYMTSFNSQLSTLNYYITPVMFVFCPSELDVAQGVV